MSRYMVSTAKVDVPVSFQCPYCGETNLCRIRCSGMGRSLVDVRHPAGRAAEAATATARAQVDMHVRSLYKNGGNVSGAGVTDRCSRCGKKMPWSGVKAAKWESRLEIFGTVLLSGTILVAMIWFLLSLMFGFSAYFGIYILVAVAVDSCFCLYLSKSGKRRDAERERQVEERQNRMKDIPEECLPRLLVPMEMVMKEIQSDKEMQGSE